MDFITADDGLTRQSIVALGRPEQAHPAAAAHPESTPRAAAAGSKAEANSAEPHRKSSRSRLVAGTRHHRRSHRHHAAAEEEGQTAASAPAPVHRNPLVRFVYWWNGWVIRNFHTHFGTVMLDSWGAET